MNILRRFFNGKKNTIFSAQMIVLSVLMVALIVIIIKSGGARNTGGGSPSGGDDFSADALHPLYSPQALSATEPSLLLVESFSVVGGTVTRDYRSAADIDFASGEYYSSLAGITTFRGNNFRDGGSYGTAELYQKTLEEMWSYSGSAHDLTGSMPGAQPLIVQWSIEQRGVMDMYDWAKQAEELTEVVVACADGNILFFDLDTGEATRNPISTDYAFSGFCTVDPRGYPLIYIASGGTTDGENGVLIISLADGSVLYEFAAGDGFPSGVSRFGAAPLVDAGSDCLIYPGENGILYTIKLNSTYDEAGGAVSVRPEITAKWYYYSTRSSQSPPCFDSGAVTFGEHIITADSSGNAMCINLNTLEPVWAQDIVEDVNASCVLSFEDDAPYVYFCTSLNAGARTEQAQSGIYKLDALSGRIVWSTAYSCYYGGVNDVRGGVQGTMVVGKNSLAGIIYVPIARAPSENTGYLAAISADNGSELWKIETHSLSTCSPVAVYDPEGGGYIIYSTSGGYLYIIDGLAGNVLDAINLDCSFSSSPVVFNNTVVLCADDGRIFAIELK